MRHRVSHIFEGDPDPADDEFFGGLDGAVAALLSSGYDFELTSDETFADGTCQLIWEEAEERAVISVIKDGELDHCYLVITAAKRGDLRQIERHLTRRLSFETLGHLQSVAASRLWVDPTRLVRMAIGAGSRADATSLDLIRSGLTHRGPRVRLYASLAAGHTRWPQLLPDLEKSLRSEPEEAVKKVIRRALDACTLRSARGA